MPEIPKPTEEQINQSNEASEAGNEKESNFNAIASLLKENLPPKEARETSLEDIKLTKSLLKKVDDYKRKLEDGGAREDAIQDLTVEYARNLEKTQQDPRPYIGLENRSFYIDRVNEEIRSVIPEDRDIKTNDTDRIFRFDHDLDEFKTVNDYYGHQAGDEILKKYSEILKSGDAANWLKDLGVLDERDEDNPNSMEVTVEGGEEFGGLLIFREDFNEITLEDDKKLKTREEVVQEFIKRIQEEANRKFKELLTQENEDGSPKFPVKTKLPQGITLPENFVMDSGASFGYASMTEALNNATVSETEIGSDNIYDIILDKIKGQLFEISDIRAQQNKEKRKVGRETSEDENKKITAEISPRGRAETLERQGRETQRQLDKTKGQLESANRFTTKLIDKVYALKAALESAQGTNSYEIMKPMLEEQINGMESDIEAYQREQQDLLKQ